jgi:hypothetical protein
MAILVRQVEEEYLWRSADRPTGGRPGEMLPGILNVGHLKPVESDKVEKYNFECT